MKKLLPAILAALILSSASMLTVSAETTDTTTAATAEVFVTVSDKDGKLALALEPITVTDTDNDGTITVDEALCAAHEAKYEGGATAGYASTSTEWGLSLTKLWGEENGGSYGYYVNHTSPGSLAGEVKDGDTINAFIYTDLTTWSDTYCYFDKNTVNCTVGEEISLVLTYAGYDESWNPVTLPVEGAIITIDGIPTEYQTDADGKVSIQLETAGTSVISAASETMTLVPPAMIVTAAEETQTAPTTADPSLFALLGAALSVSALGITSTFKKRNEK